MDVTELPIFMGCGGGLSEADLHQEFSLDDVISSVNIPSPVRTRQTTRYHENIVAFAMRAFFTTNKMNLQVVVDSQVPGQTYLHPIETSSDKRPDVTVYDSSCQKVVLLVEVQSSPMREVVNKSIQGAADLLRLLCCKDVDFDQFSVFALPKCGVRRCAVKITVTWKDRHFNYELKLLTIVNDLWSEIKCVVESQANVPSLPDEENINRNFLVPLSRRDLSAYGENAKQMESPHHIMIDNVVQIYKVVTKYSEKDALKSLILAVAFEKNHNPKHFILPMPVSETDIFAYAKVFYGPLDRLQARQCLRTLVKKIHEALSELHCMGFAHADNCKYEAVLIDMDRCVRRNMYPNAAMSFEGASCMYNKPNRIDADNFNGEHLDYLQLGWLVAWVLSSDSNYHNRTWVDQDNSITTDKFVSTLVLEGTYDESALLGSTVVTDIECNFFQIFK